MSQYSFHIDQQNLITSKMPLYKNFRDGLIEKGLEPDYVMKNYKYIGKEGGKIFKSYFPDKAFPSHETNCICSHEIIYNFYVCDKSYEFSTILIVGSCCVKQFFPNRERECLNCGEINKNNTWKYCNNCKDNYCIKCKQNLYTKKISNTKLCNECYKTICRNCAKESSQKYNDKLCNDCGKLLTKNCLACNLKIVSMDDFCKLCKDKPKCNECHKLLKNDKYKKCFQCMKKYERKCIKCGTIHYSNYISCYNCWNS